VVCGGVCRHDIIQIIERWPFYRVEPLLYQSILVSSATLSGFPVFSVDILLRVIATKPPKFLQNAVRNLFIEDATQSEAAAILMACNRVTNLILFEHSLPLSNVPLLGALQFLRQLAVSIEAFAECCTVDDVPALFPNITHLELLDTYWDPTLDVHGVCARLALIANLTHVAFNFAPLNDVFYSILRADTRLRCIAFFSLHADEMKNTDALADDSRFVCINPETDFRVEWLRGAQTGNDYWVFADSFIAARRAGEVDRELKSS
jgi:hypothetical protein